jgi:hypothetical protein
MYHVYVVHYLIKPFGILITMWGVFVACRNIKTRWLSILVPAVRLMNEYKPLLAKLHVDATVRKPKNIARKCYSGLTDVQIVVGLACILPMLWATSSLMKAAQRNDVFISDYLAAVKTLQVDLAQMYLEPKTQFTQATFWDFNALVDAMHDAIPMRWIPSSNTLDLNASGAEYLAFTPKEHMFRATFWDPITQENIPITREVYAAIIAGVKTQAAG